MSLSAFVRDHHEDIITEFAVFARTLMPPGGDMSEAELRDHAEEILIAVVEDMSTAQTSHEQVLKSQGRGSANIMRASGRLHADHRIEHGFQFRSVLAEFRALRATVLRLYAESGATDLKEVARFNEAIDEVLTASMDRFAVQTEKFRDQFIGVLSHDLRTPLDAITAGAALLALPELQHVDAHPLTDGRLTPSIVPAHLSMRRCRQPVRTNPSEASWRRKDGSIGQLCFQLRH